MKLNFLGLTIWVFMSCSGITSGELLVYGNLYSDDCNTPIQGAKVFLIDAIFLSSGAIDQVLKLDSIATDMNGRFEFVAGYYPEIHDLGLLIETVNSTFNVKIVKPITPRHLNIDICED